MITIKEIAEIARVSRGTVDRVVNKRGGVTPAVERRINALLEQYEYKANRVARALVKRKKLYTIGMISSTVENIFFKDIVEGMRCAAAEVKDQGVSLLYREVAKFSSADQIRCIDEMLEHGVDGLAINPINDEQVRRKLVEIVQQGIPVITFNSDIEGVERLAYIGCDYRTSGRIAAGLIGFATQGQGNVAIITGSLKSLGHCMRIEGFREESQRYPKISIAGVVEMFDDEVTSYAAVRDLLAKERAIDAFFFSAGGKEGGIRAIREAMLLRPPHIVTVDLDAFTEECLMNETVAATVCQQPFVQGYEPVRQLVDYLMHGELPARPIQYTRAEIIIRQSLSNLTQTPSPGANREKTAGSPKNYT